MPKRVDAAARRAQVADAMIDEIAEHGFCSVTLARIAARAGFAVGSVRHYFGDTAREVMRFTLGELQRRLSERGAQASRDPVSRIVDLVSIAAPTDELERRENAAFVEYRVMARTDPELGAEVEATSLAGARVVRSLLQDALVDRVVGEESLRRETLLLFTLLEGFSFSAALQSQPLHEHEVRDVVASAMQRMRDAYPRRHGSQASRP